MDSQKRLLAEKLWMLHEQYNILENTKLGNKLFWQLLKWSNATPYDITIKKLNCDVGVATSALRNVLRRLERDGWVVVCPHPDDSRVRCVLVTQKFKELANNYMQEMDRLFSEFEETRK